MRVFALGAIGLALCLQAAPAAAAREDVCSRLAQSIERAHGIPRGLVQAVALAESGRWTADDGGSRPWPWTITSGDESYYLDSKEEALEKVRELQARGRTNIDVGCMQVNLHYHGHNFGSVEQALDPAANVQYAAGFLRSLREESRSWGLATARYHSRTKARGERYRAKVYRLWNEVRRRTSDDRRLAPQQIALSALARDADPLVEPAASPAETSSPRLKRPLIDLKVRSAPPGGLRIIRGD